MKKLSPQSKSFLILFVIAVLGAYACLWYSQRLIREGKSLDYNAPQSANYNITTYPNTEVSPLNTKETSTVDTEQLPDTTSWKSYSDKKYNFSFLYPPTWKIKAPIKKYGNYAVEVNAGKKYDKMHVYVTNGGYFALDGLPAKTITISNRPSVNILDLLYGITNKDYYLTFDIGSTPTLKDQFKAMVRSLSFTD